MKAAIGSKEIKMNQRLKMNNKKFKQLRQQKTALFLRLFSLVFITSFFSFSPITGGI